MQRRVLSNKNRMHVEGASVLSKQDIKKCLSCGDLVIKPFNESDLGPCDINAHISDKYARIRGCKQVLDLFDYNALEFIDSKYFVVEQGKEYVIQPDEHLLIESLEYFEIPNYVTALIGLRSTFSRLGANTPPTVVDPGFKGKLVFHLIGSSFPIKLHEGVAIFKVIFMYLTSDTEPYCGKYQNQSGIVLPKSDPEWKHT